MNAIDNPDEYKNKVRKIYFLNPKVDEMGNREYPEKINEIKVAKYLALMRECFAMSVKNKAKPA